MAAKPKIAMIGKGNVGTALSSGLNRSGYEVRMIGRDPERVRETAKWGDVIILAVPFSERDNALREMGDAVKGKVLVDVTNALNSSFGLAIDFSKSGAEELQEKARDAKVVKAFNTVFAQNMTTGQVKGEKLTLFIAGNHADAKKKVIGIGLDLGFDAIDAGPLENARWLETLGFFNIQLGYGLKMGPNIGFRLVH